MRAKSSTMTTNEIIKNIVGKCVIQVAFGESDIIINFDNDASINIANADLVDNLPCDMSKFTYFGSLLGKCVSKLSFDDGNLRFEFDCEKILILTPNASGGESIVISTISGCHPL